MDQRWPNAEVQPVALRRRPGPAGRQDDVDKAPDEDGRGLRAEVVTSTTRRSSASATAREGARGRRIGGFLTPPWWFVVPALLVYAVVVLYPSIAGVVYAFTDWSGIGDKSFVGLANFRTLLHDDRALGVPAQHAAADRRDRHRAERHRAAARARRTRAHQVAHAAAGDLLRAGGRQPGDGRVPVEVRLQPRPQGRAERHPRRTRPRRPAPGLAGQPVARAVVGRRNGRLAVRRLLDGDLPGGSGGHPGRAARGRADRWRGALPAVPLCHLAAAGARRSRST